MDILLLVIMGITALVSFKGFNDYDFFRKYEFHVGRIRAGEQLRMITSGFLHLDFAHLIFNMLTLYFFAPIVIDRLGNIYFLYIYFGSMVAGSLLTLYMHKNDYSYRAIGASGAVMGVIYASILLDINQEMKFYGFIPSYIFGIVYLLYSIYGMKAKKDNIGHTAHFGGAIGGYLITLIREPSLFETNTKNVVLLMIPIIILFYMNKTNKL
ncbi:rhomboid family intramembrane serine protease [Flavobacterium sp. TP390]|uniref:Rhomboid family intramembrane serine protease n=1 Tax=Flavobacterium profundi TaxID=1774945 RepID=A0A6I4IIK4_9FLAO|nr:rhomboid family intramembrane serine protease [Flavobacterium profundi]MVO09424.1 rhomboid family intramembrane serine protease [Flavobacterium profundi]